MVNLQQIAWIENFDQTSDVYFVGGGKVPLTYEQRESLLKELELGSNSEG